MAQNNWQPAPPLPGFSAAERSAHTTIWPVWSGSVDADNVQALKTRRLTRKQQRDYLKAAVRLEQETRTPGKRGGCGAIGRASMAVHKALIGCMGEKTGAIYPTQKTLGVKTNYSERHVQTAKGHLKDLGMISWTRRCRDGRSHDEKGHFAKHQTSNWYIIHPPSKWRGYQEPPPPRWTPKPGTWGDPMPISDEQFDREAASIAATPSLADYAAQEGPPPTCLADATDAHPWRRGGKPMPLSQAEYELLTDAQRQSYDRYRGTIWNEHQQEREQAPERFAFTLMDFYDALFPEGDPPPWARAECDRLEEVIWRRLGGGDRLQTAGGLPGKAARAEADSPISRQPDNPCAAG
jgi:hypothetical protein